MAEYDTSYSTGDELDAVNDLLAAIGESPVSTLEGDSNADVVNARRILNKVNRTVQSKGWTFNIEEVTLQPDTFSKLIPWLPTYLDIQVSGGNPYKNRGGYVYDRVNKTDEFTAPITVNMIQLIPFSEMPTQFRDYIIVKSARIFNRNFFGAPEVDESLAGEEAEAHIAITEWELDYGNFNIYNNDPFVSSAVGR